MYIISAKDTNDPLVVPSNEVKNLWPKMVLNYYIDNIEWSGTNGKNDPNQENQNDGIKCEYIEIDRNIYYFPVHSNTFKVVLICCDLSS